MADRWAVVVGVEKPLHPENAPLPFADADAKAVAAALVPLAAESRRLVLFGQYATKAAIESRLRRLRKQLKKADEVLVFWAGRGAGDRLTCWDTLPDDSEDTSLELDTLVSAVEKATRAVFLLATPGLTADALGTAFDSSPHAALVACGDEEDAVAAPDVKAGLWSQLVVESLSGQARKAADRDGTVTARGIQRHVEDELPRRLRKHFEAGVVQTPTIYGNADTVVARFQPIADEAVLDPGRLRRVVFRTESHVRVRDLSQFRKSFQLPDAATPSARKFIARLATDDIRADLERVHDAAREHLGYKRKDIELKAEQDGTGFVRTPDFEYTVLVDLDPDEPTRVVWRREAGQFTDPGFVRGDGFRAVFPAVFDRLVFEFARPLDVAGFIDRVEDAPPAGIKLNVDADGKACDITLSGFAGAVRVQRHALTIRGRAGDAPGLLDQFLQFLSKFGPVGEPLMLPPAK